MSQINLTTKKMSGEGEQQYTAWILYCEYGSIDKLMKAWEGMRLNATEMRPDLRGFMEKLGEPPVRTTLARWSKKFCWVERRDLKLAEDLQALREKTKKIIADKKHKIAEVFERVMNKRLKQLREGESVTTLDLKQVWEMFQVEIGKPTSMGQLNVENQGLLTPEQKEHGQQLHEALKEVIRIRHRKKK